MPEKWDAKLTLAERQKLIETAREEWLGEVREALTSNATAIRVGAALGMRPHQVGEVINAALATIADQSSTECANCGGYGRPGENCPECSGGRHKPDCESSTECAERSDDWLGRTLDRAHQSVEERPEYLKPARYRSGRVECDNCLKEKPDVRWVGGEEGAYVCADCIAESSESSTESHGKDGSELRSADKPSITEPSTDQVGEKEPNERWLALIEALCRAADPDLEDDFDHTPAGEALWDRIVAAVLANSTIASTPTPSETPPEQAQVSSGNSDAEQAVRVLTRFMCCKAGEQYVEEKLLSPFGFTLDAGPVVRENSVLREDAHYVEVLLREMVEDIDGGDDVLSRFRRRIFGVAQYLKSKLSEHPEQTGRAVSGSEKLEKRWWEDDDEAVDAAEDGFVAARSKFLGRGATPDEAQTEGIRAALRSARRHVTAGPDSQSPKTGGEG